MRLFCLIATLCCLFSFANNQAFAQQVRKEYRDAMVWPEAELIYITSERSFLTAGSQFRHNTDENSGEADPDKPWSAFQEIRLNASFQYEFPEQWRVGFGQRISFEENAHRWFSMLNLRHVGKIGSVSFIKRGMLEHIRTRNVPEPGPNQLPTEPLNRARLSVALERTFVVAGNTLVPDIEYEVLWELGQETENLPNPPRRIDRTRLRAGLSYYINSRSSISAYFMRETNYYNFLEQFDAEGNSVRGGKTNIIVPIYGLEYRYNIKLTDQEPVKYRR